MSSSLEDMLALIRAAVLLRGERESGTATSYPQECVRRVRPPERRSPSPIPRTQRRTSSPGRYPPGGVDGDHQDLNMLHLGRNPYTDNEHNWRKEYLPASSHGTYRHVLDGGPPTDVYDRTYMQNPSERECYVDNQGQRRFRSSAGNQPDCEFMATVARPKQSNVSDSGTFTATVHSRDLITPDTERFRQDFAAARKLDCQVTEILPGLPAQTLDYTVHLGSQGKYDAHALGDHCRTSATLNSEKEFAAQRQDSGYTVHLGSQANYNAHALGDHYQSSATLNSEKEFAAQRQDSDYRVHLGSQGKYDAHALGDHCRPSATLNSEEFAAQRQDSAYQARLESLGDCQDTRQEMVSFQDSSMHQGPGLDSQLLWVVGDSLVFWAARHPLALDTSVFPGALHVRWVGVHGLEWAGLRKVLSDTAARFGVPRVLVIHLGGNDLGVIKSVGLILAIKEDIKWLVESWKGIKIIWSDITPRRVWCSPGSGSKLDEARKKVNAAVGRFIMNHGGLVVRHHMLRHQYVHLFRPDGMLLTDEGIGLFLEQLFRGMAQAIVSLVN